MNSPSHLPFFGPAGWAYPSWNRIVYPRPHPPGFHPLQQISTFFDTVEINTSFYAPLRPEVTRLWALQVQSNPRFRFTAKVCRAFTHDRMIDSALTERVHEGFRPLMESKRLGCLLLQFPWSFRFTSENREYLIQLRRVFHSYPLVAEMRHNSWMRDEALGTFVDYHIGFVNIDQPQHVKAMPPTAFLTTGIGYVRLHGRTASAPMDEIAVDRGMGHESHFLYSPLQLAEWKQRIDRLRSFTSEVYVITNNDSRAKSLVNALQLRAMVEGRAASAPPELVRHYAQELRGYVTGPRQEPLFATGSAPRREAAA